MSTRVSKVIFAAVLLAIGWNVPQAAADYPDRAITMLIPFAPGGNTDANGRIVAALLEKKLGVQVRPVNRTGGGGVVGHTAIRDAEPDGYTIGYAVSEVTMMHWAGLTDLTFKDYSLLGQMTADAAAVHVAAGSNYNQLSDLLAAIKSNPGTLKTSGSGEGGPWHLATSGMLDAEGIDPTAVTWVPSQGCAAAMQELAAGGIDFAVCALIEAQPLREAGKLRTLALIDGSRNPGFPEVETLKEATGSNWVLNDWGGVVAPKGLPADVEKKLVTAIAEIAASDEFKSLVSKSGTVPVYRGPEEFAAYLQEMDSNFGDVMKKVGIAK